MTYKQVNKRILALISIWTISITVLFICYARHTAPNWLLIVALVWTISVAVIYVYWSHLPLKEPEHPSDENKRIPLSVEAKYAIKQAVWVKFPTHCHHSVRKQPVIWSQGEVKGFSKTYRDGKLVEEYLVESEDGYGWVEEDVIRTTEPEKDVIEKFLLTIPELDREDRLWVIGYLQEKIQEKQKQAK